MSQFGYFVLTKVLKRSRIEGSWISSEKKTSLFDGYLDVTIKRIYIIFSFIPIFEILVFDTSRKFDLLFERDFRKLFRLAFLTSGSTPFMIGRIALIPTYAALMKN